MPRRKRRPFAPVEYETATAVLEPPPRVPPPGTLFHAPLIRVTRKAVDEQFSNFDKQLNAEKIRRSLYRFIKAAWHISDPGTPFVDCWYIEAICEHLEAVTFGQIKKLIINIPPGHAKSRISCVHWLAWEWLTFPERSSLYGSYDEGLALRDSDLCRDIIKSDWYQRTFEPEWAIAKKQDAKGYYKNTRQGFRYSFNMNGQITGWRGSRVVVDDPLSTKNRFNPLAKASNVDVWDRTLSSRVNDKQKDAFVLIMQRLADDDLTGHLLKKNEDLLEQDPTGRLLAEQGYDHLMLPTKFEEKRRSKTSIGWQDPRAKEGELLCPERFSEKTVEAIETLELGPDDYQAQHQHRPVREGGAKFLKAWFRYYYFPDPHNRRIAALINHENGTEKIVRLDTGWVMAAMDCANGLKLTNDFASITVWGVTKDYEALLLERHSVKLEGPSLINLTKQIHSKKFANNRIVKWSVEQNGLGLPTAQAMAMEGLPVEFVAVNKDKLVESTTARVRYAAGFIYHPQYESCDWIQEFEDNLTIFPAGKHDDDVSSVSLMANSLYGSFGGIVGSEAVPKQEMNAHERQKQFSARTGAGGQRWRAR